MALNTGNCIQVRRTISAVMEGKQLQKPLKSTQADKCVLWPVETRGIHLDRPQMILSRPPRYSANRFSGCPGAPNEFSGRPPSQHKCQNHPAMSCWLEVSLRSLPPPHHPNGAEKPFFAAVGVGADSSWLTESATMRRSSPRSSSICTPLTTGSQVLSPVHADSPPTPALIKGLGQVWMMIWRP